MPHNNKHLLLLANLWGVWVEMPSWTELSGLAYGLWVSGSWLGKESLSYEASHLPAGYFGLIIGQQFKWGGISCKAPLKSRILTSFWPKQDTGQPDFRGREMDFIAWRTELQSHLASWSHTAKAMGTGKGGIRATFATNLPQSGCYAE